MDVMFEVTGRSLPLPENQARALANTLHLFAERRLLTALGDDEGWIDGALKVAHAIDDVLVERRRGPIALGGATGEAVYQALLPSYTKAADRATLDLFAALHQLYG